uniref:Uncharacterized protein n=1 Tax=Callorhinchus milii TaxID=7868 RepID=A0A4W3K8D6_CALMI
IRLICSMYGVTQFLITSQHLKVIHRRLLSNMVTVFVSKHSTRNCFDLYEEILTEERTAKETSFKEVTLIEREKQVGELMKKMQELQTQNSTLANENIQLKKNMSALIKTARLEVVRKDEEINRLNRRENDRAILLDCQQKGANETTFSYLATSLNRSPRQVNKEAIQLKELSKLIPLPIALQICPP